MANKVALIYGEWLVVNDEIRLGVLQTVSQYLVNSNGDTVPMVSFDLRMGRRLCGPVKTIWENLDDHRTTGVSVAPIDNGLGFSFNALASVEPTKLVFHALGVFNGESTSYDLYLLVPANINYSLVKRTINEYNLCLVDDIECDPEKPLDCAIVKALKQVERVCKPF